MRSMQAHVSQRIESKRLIRRKISQINLQRNIKGRIKFKQIARRVT